MDQGHQTSHGNRSRVQAARPALASPVSTLATLQRSAGNAATTRLISSLQVSRQQKPADTPDAGVPADAGVAAAADAGVIGSYVIQSTDAGQRQQIEELAKNGGRNAPRKHYDEAWLEHAKNKPVAGVPENGSEMARNEEMLGRFHLAVGKFEREVDASLAAFEAAGKDTMRGILDKSEERAHGELIRYGITSKTERIVRGSKAGVHYEDVTTYIQDADSAGGKQLGAAAKLLLEKGEAAEAARRAYNDVLYSYASGIDADPRAPAPPELGPLGEKMSAADKDRDIYREGVAGTYPLLASFTEKNSWDWSALRLLSKGPGDDAAKVAGEKIAENLADITKVRDELKPGGGVNVFKLDKIVALTKAKQATPADSWQLKVLDEHISDVKSTALIMSVALAVINLALLAVGPVTGGLSLIGAAALSTAAAISSAQEFMLESAMAGSDLEKARALSQHDPSLFWLAVEIVGAALDVGQGAAAAGKLLGNFRKVAAVTKEVQLARTSAEADEALARLEQVAKEVGGEKLAKSVLAEVSGEGKAAAVSKDLKVIEEAGGLPATAAKEAGEAVTKTGGVVHVTPKGKLFSCSSPCTELRAKYFEALSRDKSGGLMKQITDLEAEAKALGVAPTKSQLNGIAKKVAALDESLQAANRLHKAEEIAAWLPTAAKDFPILAEAKLDAAAIARILEKSEASHRKGQLLEELLAARIRAALADETAKVALLGEKAVGKAAEFVPGHLVRDVRGKQFSDGLVIVREGDTVHVMAVIEAKAGKASAAELKGLYTPLKDMTDDELKILRMEAIEEWRQANAGKIPGARTMKSADVDANFKSDVDKILKDMPKTEAGQGSLDIERIGRDGALFLDGQLTKVRGGRQTKVVAGVPSDVPKDALTKNLGKKQGLNVGVEQLDLSSKQLHGLAEEIAARGVRD